MEEFPPLRPGWRWLLVIARSLGWVAVFSIIIVPHLIATLCGRRDLVPPPFLGALAWIAGVRVRTQGTPEPGALFLANHLSWLDILALAGASRSVFVAHSGLAENGALEWLCAQNDTLFITRDVRGSIGKQVEMVRQRLGHRRLTIFPEATTGDGRELLTFRSSLLSAVENLPDSVAVQPVALDYADAPAIAWVGAEPGVRNFVAIMSRTKPIHLTIRFLAPLAGAELTNRKTMAAAAQRRIEDALGWDKSHAD